MYVTHYGPKRPPRYARRKIAYVPAGPSVTCIAARDGLTRVRGGCSKICDTVYGVHTMVPSPDTLTLPRTGLLAHLSLVLCDPLWDSLQNLAHMVMYQY
jgi:hypothetical protein